MLITSYISIAIDIGDEEDVVDLVNMLIPLFYIVHYFIPHQIE